MAQVIYSKEAMNDLDRLADFLLGKEAEYAAETADLIIEAIAVLENHPHIGRVVNNDLHELIISRGRTGYVALYSIEDNDKTDLILTIKHQREVGYSTFPS